MTSRFWIAVGNFEGFISRRRLLKARKKQVILVDHNEKAQAVDGIEEAEVLEIIDHHRLSSIETMGPVFFRNQPVGCTGNDRLSDVPGRTSGDRTEDGRDSLCSDPFRYTDVPFTDLHTAG